MTNESFQEQKELEYNFLTVLNLVVDFRYRTLASCNENQQCKKSTLVFNTA
ncbi:hypothetical protein JOC85_002019 [Bacillus mesophilus]|uniref:Uncharacterized protein n=1 Tax=Bacillus mesophilus TaxID=1808955 RepID=A0A6M0Q863_9BACI|nr:hypothetical protein [Bacillus mesophilus]MBM7661247.1 hypothetical protein [Bacillus mesophilus]NEY71228.1 hypothetical protein [Bacillus mesophilus]